MKVNNFRKFSLRVLLSFCLIFCQFQPGVAYKSVAYKKRVIIVWCMPANTLRKVTGNVYGKIRVRENLYSGLFYA